MTNKCPHKHLRLEYQSLIMFGLVYVYVCKQCGMRVHYMAEQLQQVTEYKGATMLCPKDFYLVEDCSPTDKEES